jgi:hypothetical protein
METMGAFRGDRFHHIAACFLLAHLERPIMRCAKTEKAMSAALHCSIVSEIDR